MCKRCPRVESTWEILQQIGPCPQHEPAVIAGSWASVSRPNHCETQTFRFVFTSNLIVNFQFQGNQDSCQMYNKHLWTPSNMVGQLFLRMFDIRRRRETWPPCGLSLAHDVPHVHPRFIELCLIVLWETWKVNQLAVLHTPPCFSPTNVQLPASPEFRGLKFKCSKSQFENNCRKRMERYKRLHKIATYTKIGEKNRNRMGP